MNQDLETPENLIKNYGRNVIGRKSGKTQVIKNQITSARNEAEKIVSEADEYSVLVRSQAKEDADNLREKGYRDGLDKALLEMEQNLLDIREVRDRVMREVEQDLLRLSVRLAEKILGREIDKDNKAIVNIVATALVNARQQEKLTVRINPADVQIVEKEIENVTPSGKIRYLDFVADPRVSIGGCMIESEVGTIDARLETQLRILERALLAQSEGESIKE